MKKKILLLLVVLLSAFLIGVKPIHALSIMEEAKNLQLIGEEGDEIEDEGDIEEEETPVEEENTEQIEEESENPKTGDLDKTFLIVCTALTFSAIVIGYKKLAKASK